MYFDKNNISVTVPTVVLVSAHRKTESYGCCVVVTFFQVLCASQTGITTMNPATMRLILRTKSIRVRHAKNVR